jgi:hypothetical protein
MEGKHQVALICFERDHLQWNGLPLILVLAYFYAPVVGLKLRKPTSANASNNSTMSRPPITGPKPPYQWLSENERYTWTKTPRPFRLG